MVFAFLEIWRVEFVIYVLFLCNVVSCHCVALDLEGRCYTWGRNEACCLCSLEFQLQFVLLWLLIVLLYYVFLSVQKGQLGHGDKLQRDRPTIVSELSKCVTLFRILYL